MTTHKDKIPFEAITREQVRDYAEASGDHNPIHLDPEFAKKAGLPDVIAHGMLSMGLAGLALEKWGYSMERLRHFESKFKEKVFIGDELFAEHLDEASVKLSDTKQIKVSWHLIKADATEVLTAEALFDL